MAEGPAAEGRSSTLRMLLRTPAGIAGALLLGAVLVAALTASVVGPQDPFASVGAPLQPPSADNLMGTDDLGRDILSGVVHGARTSLFVVLSVLAIAGPIGMAVGMVAGYRGGLVDDVLMRVTEIFQTLPLFFVAVVVVALFGPGMVKLVLVLGLSSWPVLARVVRAESLSLKQREFVEAARSVGASNLRILVRHILPNVMAPAVVMLSLMGATVILLEAALGFIGLGDPAVMSWGYMANNAQRFLRVAWWMAVFPGAAIVIAVLGLNLFGDAMNDLKNPLTGRRPYVPPSL